MINLQFNFKKKLTKLNVILMVFSLVWHKLFKIYFNIKIT